MADNKLILVCKDKPMADNISKVLIASGKITADNIECWEEKTWDVKRKSGPVHSKILFVGNVKDTDALSCFIDIRYERWGIRYGINPRYAIISADTVYVKDSARYKAFLSDFEEVLGPVLDAPAKETSKVAKTFGTVGLAVATGGASLAAQKLYDDNKNLEEKAGKLCLYGVWHFADNCLEEFMGE
ncbi:hypothetical protein [Butyrivibrio sp. AE2032]|uniref:hypothetical protein n=1 Tax=Butyrivibrio sp. AE2032 TaxID=1458463 RepID=UPI00055179EF|nr:hypothetical protein [Butyrivibrio sp. AE2032]